jgi:hypothetical protein
MSSDNSNAIDMNSLMERLVDADIPGYYATFTDEEAALLGTFDEDAISGESALAGSFHNPDFVAEVGEEMPRK